MFEKLSGWGGFPRLYTEKKIPKTIEELKRYLKEGSAIARGNGRAYGDSAISKKNTISMSQFNRFLEFDDDNGLLTVEAGVLLSDVIKIFLPKGWFLPVTPGTKFVSIGGMVAADVHGKNHFKNGSFGNYVKWIDILNSEGNIIRCSRKQNNEIFYWTLGGMGLTGIIINVAFFLKPIGSAWIKQKTLIAKNIKEAIDIFEKNLNSTYIAAWIDCNEKGNNLGRSLIMLGEHAKLNDLNKKHRDHPFLIKTKKAISIPFYFPSSFLNKFTIKMFNNLYFLKGKMSKKNILVDWNKYFYPLDNVLNWNKIYGKKGFVQFQCVIPLNYATIGITKLLEAISKYNSLSFLAVLKRFGKQNSYFSFPMEGYSIALDFPLNKKNLNLLNELDQITLKYHGRFYIAKDSRMQASTFLKSDKRIADYKAFRSKDMKSKFASNQSERLGL